MNRVAMRAAFVVALAGASAACASILGVTDIPDAPPSDASAEGASLHDAIATSTDAHGDAFTETDGRGDANTTSDAFAENDGDAGLVPDTFVPPTCSLPEKACGAVCVNVGTSGSNCGRCGHSCGDEAACSQGQCTPITVATGYTNISYFAVDQGNVFFVDNEDSASTIFECLVTGCAPAVTLYSNSRLGSETEGIYAGGGFFAYEHISVGGTADGEVCLESGCGDGGIISFGSKYESGNGNSGAMFISSYGYGSTQRTNVTTCNSATGACQRTQVYGSATAYYHKATDGTNVLLDYPPLDGGYSGLSACPLTGCTTPITMTTASFDDAVLFGGTAYILHQGYTGNSNGSIDTCSATSGCNGSPNVFLSSGTETPSELTVDSSGAYWIEASTGKIKMCPLGSTCPLPTLVATGVGSDASQLLVAEGFVYWIQSTSMGSGEQEILRVGTP